MIEVFELKQSDIDDLLRLVSSPSLTITANNAIRVAQLQALLSAAKPLPYRSEADYATVLQRWKDSEERIEELNKELSKANR